MYEMITSTTNNKIPTANTEEIAINHGVEFSLLSDVSTIYLYSNKMEVEGFRTNNKSSMSEGLQTCGVYKVLS